MNKINFKGKNGGIFHHLTPYRKKSKTVIFKEKSSHIEQDIGVNVEKITLPNYDYATIRLQMEKWSIGHQNETIFRNPCVEIPLNTEPMKKITEPKIKVVNNPQDYKHKNGFKMHHSHQSFVLNNQSLSVTDSIGGCGMQQFYAWTGILNENNAYDLIDYYIKNRNSSVGLIICQLGQDYFNHHFEKALIKHNFKILSEYKNFTHGSNGRYKQRVYGLELELNSIKRDEGNN